MSRIDAALQALSKEIRRNLKRLGWLLAADVVHMSTTQVVNSAVNNADYSQIPQIGLVTHYKTLAKRESEGLDFDDVGFKCYSQNSEDGILLYIFSIIGTTNKIAVEICAGNGIECNAANLVINHGWWALLFDGNAKNIAQGSEFYRVNPRCSTRPPRLLQAWITRDNINDLIRNNGISGEIDLLSIDIDGND
jgi:hypothetical protein